MRQIVVTRLWIKLWEAAKRQPHIVVESELLVAREKFVIELVMIVEDFATRLECL